VWVPSAFHKQEFMKSGADGSKVFVIPEPIDTSLFSPELIENKTFIPTLDSNKFNFLSIFKWEASADCRHCCFLFLID
jgi:glycosyltransferase involved in cell wall biosynthesis